MNREELWKDLPKPPKRRVALWVYRTAIVVSLLFGAATGSLVRASLIPDPPKPKTPMARVQTDLLDLYNEGCAAHVTMKQFASLDELKVANVAAAEYMDQDGVEYRIVSARLPGIIVRYLGIVVWCETPPA